MCGEGFFIISGVISYEDIFEDRHAEEFYFRTSGQCELVNMDWPERMSPFPLTSIVKGIQAKEKKRKSKNLGK